MNDNNLKDNYEIIDKTFSFIKANIIGIFLAIPILILGPVLYQLLVDKASTSSTLVIFLGFILGIFIHEFIHGFTWHLFCKNNWKSIKFGIDKKTLSPYTTCTEALPVNSYKLGAVMPFIITGVIPYIIGILLNNASIVYIGAILMACSVGDLMILFKILWEKGTSYCCDHPVLCGCIIYRKIKK